MARSFVGVPFCHQGRSREEGLDCVGLIVSIYTLCGWEPRNNKTLSLAYNRDPDGDNMKLALLEECYKVSWTDKREGDIILMKYGRSPQHVGLLLSRRSGWSIIHAIQQGVTEHIWDRSWIRHLEGVYRVYGE